MTVSSSTNRASYSGNGSLITFAYGFKVFDQDDLTVILRASNGTETVQTITTDYTVTGVGDVGGGNVVFGTAPASGVTVVILREMDLEQGLDLVPNDPFPAQSLEDSLDKLTFMVQQHDEQLGRAIKASRTNVITGSEFVISAADRANKVFAFDSSGDVSITQEIGTFRGDWAASTAYVERDLVKDTTTNDVFIVNSAHTSSGSLPLTTNTNSAKYEKIIDISNPPGDLTVGGNISTSGSVTAGSFVIGSADINENDLESIDSITAGTVAASKAVVVDVNKDISSFRNLTATGDITFGGLSDGAITVTDILDEDDLTSNSATSLATQQSIKAYVDSQVGSFDTLAEVLANGNTTGGTNLSVSTGDDIKFADGSQAIFGAGDDLRINHNGSYSYISDLGEGPLFIGGNDEVSIMNGQLNEYKIKAETNGAVTLYYDNAVKMATTNLGIDVTGTITFDGGETTADLYFGDNDKAIFGAGSDLQIYSDGTTGQITGDVNITGTLTSDGLTVAGNVSVDGGTIKLDGNYPVGTQNVALGDTALDSVQSDGNYNTAIGHASLTANTTGDTNSALGRESLLSNTTGSANTAVGYTALLSNTTAGNNTAVGYQAGYSNTTSGLMTAIGSRAAYSNTTGARITAVGYQAAYSNTTGTNNVAIGANISGYTGTLGSNTTGNYNVAIGDSALNFSTTASSNTALGYAALLFNTTASNNTAVGYQAGYNNTTGTLDAFGAFSLKANTTGSSNTGIGRYALVANTTGGGNVAIGQSSLVSNTTAGSNTAVGYQALYTVATSGENTALGYQAGYNATLVEATYVGYRAGYGVTTGASGTAVGRLALGGNSAGVTGGENVAVGNAAMYVVTSGADNVAVGALSLFDNTTGSYNTALGSDALGNNTTASNNVAVGYQALYANTTGAGNTALGDQAGKALTVNGGCTFIGQESGLSTTGGYNTFLGEDSGWQVTTGTKNTIIGRFDGNQGGLDIRTLSNNIVLSDGDGNPRFRIDANGTATFDNAVSAQNNNVINVNSDYPSAGTTTMYMEADGDIATRSGSYGTISDQRLKQQITTANSQWDDVKAAVVKKYKFNADVDAFADDAPEQIGWIAQELEAAGLNGVVKDGQDGFKSVKTTVLMIKAFKALQEAMDRIETLEAKVTALENA